MARAATAGELAKFRADGQASELFLAVHTPAAVFAAQVATAPTNNNSLTVLDYQDVTTGAYTDILPGMTMYVGTSAGAYDKGMCRVRKLADDTYLYVGETSEINFEAGDYLTVVDEFGLWAKHLRTPTSTLVYMDYDITYTDQHKNPDPVPVLGPDAVKWLPTGGTVTFSPDASASWVIGGGSITAHSWNAPGGTITAGGTIATPTIEYTSAGAYRVSDTVTASNGKSFTGYRSVFVFDDANPPIKDFRLTSCSGDSETGGWSFSVEMYDAASLTEIRDRAKVVLFARDYYGGTVESIGPVTGYENIICSGWVDGESIEWSDTGICRFMVHGPAYWLGKMTGYPTGIKNINAADPSGWIRFRDLTVDKGLWHFLHWRSTATAVMDIFLTGDTRKIPTTEAALGGLWQQLNAISDSSILAKPLCDRYGRLFVEIDTQVLPVASRSTIPTVMDVALTDWDNTDGMSIERRTVPDVGLLDVSGIYYSGTSQSPLFSKAPGRVFKRYGATASRDRLLFADQTDANATSGMMLAQMNNPYPSVSFTLVMNNRLMDIAPRQYVTVTATSSDTVRGITWAAQKFIPRRVEIRPVDGGDALVIGIDAEAETSGVPGFTYVPPAPPQYNIPGVPVTPVNPIVPPGNPWFPPIIPVPPDILDCKTDMSAASNAYNMTLSTANLDAGQSALAWFPCAVRAGAASFKTIVRLGGVSTGGALSTYTSVYGIDANQNVLVTAGAASPTIDGYYDFMFTPAAAVSVKGFKISLASGGGNTYSPGSQISTGTYTVNYPNADKISGSLTPGNWYCVEATGGPANHNGYPPPASYCYAFCISLNGSTYTNGLGLYKDVNGTASFLTAEYWEQLDAYYGRMYFQATGTDVYFGMVGLGNNWTGTLGWRLRNAYAAPARHININAAILGNICTE